MIFLNSGVEAGDDDWSPTGIVLFEFESSDQVWKWCNSPEYRSGVGQRIPSIASNTVFIDVE